MFRLKKPRTGQWLRADAGFSTSPAVGPAKENENTANTCTAGAISAEYRFGLSNARPGRTKEAKCVTVDKTIGGEAVKKWGDKASRLVEYLMGRYAAGAIPDASS
jgi:hypothetical protein